MTCQGLSCVDVNAAERREEIYFFYKFMQVKIHCLNTMPGKFVI